MKWLNESDKRRSILRIGYWILSMLLGLMSSGVDMMSQLTWFEE